MLNADLLLMGFYHTEQPLHIGKNGAISRTLVKVIFSTGVNFMNAGAMIDRVERAELELSHFVDNKVSN